MLRSFKYFFLGTLGGLILHLFALSIRWRRYGFADKRQVLGDSSPGPAPKIIAFWHGRQLLMPWVYLRSPLKNRSGISALISRHSDGRMIAHAMHVLGVQSVAGSSSAGAVSASRLLLTELEAGRDIAITPDGPRGPYRELKSGVIRLAQKSGCPIYPATYIANRYWQFKSWDKMILPKPFSTITCIIGDPIFIPKELEAGELKHYVALVREKLIALEESILGEEK
jgi:lysophospholipid acyltransferase (LPLAT)-like uncharacterized protein